MATKTPKPPAFPIEPPEHLSPEVAAVWAEVVARGAVAPSVDAFVMEAYCATVVNWRKASAEVAAGAVIDGGKGPIVHPALGVERQLAGQLKDWGPLFNRPPAAVRKRGPLYDATKESVKHLDDLDEFKGAVLAVLTLAWLIDEAQRAGLEAMQKASFVMIPSYIKGCNELQITPASMPAEWRKKPEDKGGKVTKFADAAAARRRAAG